MAVITRGEREVSLRFETFPTRARAKLEQRITMLTEELRSRIEAVTPKRTGKLSSEIKLRVYSESNQNRVAGYVSVYAGDDVKEYAKAATLEYGSDKPRKVPDRRSLFSTLLGGNRRRMEQRISKAPHIQAFRYLRGPFEQMKPEIQASLDEALAEAVAEGEA